MIFNWKLQFLYGMVEALHSIIVVIFGPYSAFPNREMEIFYFQMGHFTEIENLHFPIWKCTIRSKNDHNDRMQCPLPYHEGTEVFN